MKRHCLRTDPEPFQNVWTGKQTFQIRPDNEFQLGDTIRLEETLENTEHEQPQGRCVFTGRELEAIVTHIMRGPKYGLMAGWVCMSINVYFRQCRESDSR